MADLQEQGGSGAFTPRPDTVSPTVVAKTISQLIVESRGDLPDQVYEAATRGAGEAGKGGLDEVLFALVTDSLVRRSGDQRASAAARRARQMLETAA